MIKSGTYGTVTSIPGAQSCQPKDYTIPEPFSFTAQTGVAASQTVTSNPVTVTGVAFLAGPVSISNGSYRINAGTLTSGASLVSRGDTVTVQLLSSPSANTQTCATVKSAASASRFV